FFPSASSLLTTSSPTFATVVAPNTTPSAAKLLYTGAQPPSGALLPRVLCLRHLARRAHHPAHPELIRAHAEQRRPERLLHRHEHAPTLAQRIKQPLQRCLVRVLDRDFEA